MGIKTTGQIETLLSKQVEVTTPITGAKVIELLVEPGALVKQGQPVAVVSSPDLVELRVNSQEKLAQGQADLQQALADLKLAQQNRDRYQQITTAEIAQAQSQVAFFQEKYDKDQELVAQGALPRRNGLESQTQLAEAKANFAKANSRREVIEAENQLKRAQASVDVAKSRINLSNSTYETRLQQLGIRGNAKGLVTVTSPISGKVADREVTLSQSFEDAGGKLMTIVNDNQVFATANIYEKDLDKVKTGQQVNVKVASVPNRIFAGRIAVINSVVAGDTRVVPVKAEINNPGGVLKPGMFAELEILTNQTSSDVLIIPSAAVVEANNKKVVYIQNGNTYQPVEITLGQTSGDMVEVKTGLFNGDMIVTQRAPQLYAQSLRGDTKKKADEHTETAVQTTETKIPWWIAAAGGVFSVALSGGVISIASLVGFITLFGIATRNGLLLVDNYNTKFGEGLLLNDVLIKGSMERLNAILMTAFTSALGLAPLVIESGAGKEILQPLSIVVLGGLFTSTALTLVVLPALYIKFGRFLLPKPAMGILLFSENSRTPKIS